MAALVEALDTFTPIQSGENGHTEYTWSNDMKESLLQLSFQFTRCDSKTIAVLAEKLAKFLKQIDFAWNANKITTGTYQELLITAYKMVGHTRDIVSGKGEYALAYMQIVVWYDLYPELAFYALQCFVLLDNNDHPYGSWKDLKYFCNYCRSQNLPVEHPLIQFAFGLFNDQLRTSQDQETSLVAKWIPREKSSKFGWMFTHLATDYFKNYLVTATTPESLKRATSKAKMDYRKLIAKLNMSLDTVQIKQCGKQWAQIDHAKTTSITMMKQKKAFLNVNANGARRSQDQDRIWCAENFKNMIENASHKIKGKRVGLHEFTKEAIRLSEATKMSHTNADDLKTEIDLLNLQWADNATQTSILGPMIAMVDTSGSMMYADNGNPYYAAIALGCRIAEKSVLGKRVLTFSESPAWHNLDLCSNFTDMVDTVTMGDAGMSTNFYAALQVILDAIVEKKLDAEQASNLTLVILSDMQIDEADTSYTGSGTMHERIRAKYAETGIRVCGKPYNPPHILFWNLRSTNGFPNLSTIENTSMMSGFSPPLLNQFCDVGMESLQRTTPWMSLIDSMNGKRFQCMEDKIKTHLHLHLQM